MLPTITRPMAGEDVLDLQRGDPFTLDFEEVGKFYRALWKREEERLLAACPVGYFLIVAGVSLSSDVYQGGNALMWTMQAQYCKSAYRAIFEQAFAADRQPVRFYPDKEAAPP